MREENILWPVRLQVRREKSQRMRGSSFDLHVFSILSPISRVVEKIRLLFGKEEVLCGVG